MKWGVIFFISKAQKGFENFKQLTSVKRRMNVKILGFIIVQLFCYFSYCIAQDTLPTYRWDERSLTITELTTVVQDLTAHEGAAIYRSASAPGNTMWFGPYESIQPGNYLVQFRMKVSSNQSASLLLTADLVSSAGGYIHGSIDIKPNMFRNNNEWQLFTLPIQIIGNISNFEIRGMAFQTGVTDVYLDYITLLPGDSRGFYSKDFTVTGKGSVGIGTPDPKGYKLAVNGKARVHEIKVEVDNWPDYVFKEDYKRQTLSQLDQFIKLNKRLPDMPSAKEAETNGVDLGEMNKKLLQKIEELTLYLIEKDKQIQLLEDRMNKVLKE